MAPIYTQQYDYKHVATRLGLDLLAINGNKSIKYFFFLIWPIINWL